MRQGFCGSPGISQNATAQSLRYSIVRIQRDGLRRLLESHFVLAGVVESQSIDRVCSGVQRVQTHGDPPMLQSKRDPLRHLLWLEYPFVEKVVQPYSDMNSRIGGVERDGLVQELQRQMSVVGR